MKKNSKTFAITLLVFLLSASFLSSCKKKNDDADSNNNTTNQFTYNNQKYNLDNGTLVYFGGDGADLMYYGFFIYSSGISFDEATNHHIGNGDWIQFVVSNIESTGLPGSYPLSNDYSDSETFMGNFGVNCNVDQDECETNAEFIAGSLKIETVGEETRLTFDCTDLTGEKVSGMFKGKLNYYDLSGKKMGQHKVLR